jgi:tetratricopeptide (TPR) repeat protein
VVTASNDSFGRVWDAGTGALVGKPLRHEYDVVWAEFSPNGKLIVTASWDGTARIWDAATREPLGEPLRDGGRVNSAQFSSNGNRIVTASSNKTARFWDVELQHPSGDWLMQALSLWTGLAADERGRVHELTDQEWSKLAARFHNSRDPWPMAFRAWRHERELRATASADTTLSRQKKALEIQKVKLGADHAFTLQTMNELASSLETVGRHDEAREVLDKLCGNISTLSRQPTPYERYWVAVSLLDKGKLAENRSACAELLQSYVDSGDLVAADRAAYAYVAAPVPNSDAENLLKAGGVAVGRWVGNERVLGACFFRAGRWQDALKAFEESKQKSYEARPWDYCFLSMIHSKLGDFKQATDLLSKAREAYNGFNCEWVEHVETKALLAEATALVENSAPESK